MTMPTNRVVEHFDVVKDILARQLPGWINPAFDAFAFEQLEKAFCNRVVMAVSTTTYTGLSMMGSQKGSPFVAGKLAPLVGMNHHTLFGFAPPYRCQ
jgi:hypothetical protein